jgi:hypothetical protein
MCRTDLPSVEKTLVAPAQESEKEDEDPNSLGNMGESSSKLDALLHILESSYFPLLC